MSRLAALSQVLAQEGFDAYLACRPISMGYLAGFWEDPHERFLVLAVHSSGEVRLIAPALSASQATRIGIKDVRPWSDGEDPNRHVLELAEDWRLKGGMIAVDAEMPARFLLNLQQCLPAALFKDGESILAQLRAKKEPDELAKMKRASEIADQALQAGIEAIKVGATEQQVANALKKAMAGKGGIPTFCIVATGAGSAEPHHLTDETPIKKGDLVLMDYGCSWQGYQSDITRVVCAGAATEKQKEVYRIVRQAHQAALDGIRPGVTGAEADQMARRVIDEAGFGADFFHRLGHGIGLEGHENPNLASNNHQALEAGNCCSVEPGIYLSGEFGVRIENLIHITESGNLSFNADAPLKLPELDL